MKTTAVLILFLIAGFQSFAQKPTIVTSAEQGWQKIGETTVSFREEDESIVILGADEFSALKLKVTDAPIKIQRVQVFYESGEMQALDVDSDLLAGAETEGFELDHKDRDIQKVAFTYRTVANSNGDKAHIELHGLKTDIRQPSNTYRNQENDSVRDDSEMQVDSSLQKTEDADSASINAGQELNDVPENIENNIEEGADTISKELPQNPENATDEVNEAAANAAAGIADKVVEDKVGPEKQTIYLDQDSKYYYINAEGKKVIVDKKQLKDKKVD